MKKTSLLAFALLLGISTASLATEPTEKKTEAQVASKTEPAKTVKAPKKILEFKTGGWNMNFTGHLNTYYVYTSLDENPAVVEGNALLSSGKSGVHSVQNGLLPTALVFTANTITADSIELGVVIGGYNGTVSNRGLENSAMDLRQTYVTIGKKRMGTFTLGRNFGLFGFDAIINDISLPGVGATALVRSPLNTTLGGIGYGYSYCDRLSQINYTTPNMSGFKLTLGVYQPLSMASLGAKSDAGNNANESPGLHGKAEYAMTAGKTNIALSAAFISQAVKTTMSDFTASGIDVFAKVSTGGLALAGYFYTGKGIGTTALFFDAADAKGNARSSGGYYAQGSYTINKTKLGINYGVSNLTATANDAKTTLMQQNRLTFGVYHAVTTGLSLIAEYTSMSATNNQSGKIANSSFNIGTFLAF